MKSLWLIACFPSITWAINGVFLWPVPQSVQSGGIDLNLAGSFAINGPEVPEIQKAIRRYSRLIQRERWSPVQKPMTERGHQISESTTSLMSLDIDIKDLTADLQFGVNEAYSLDIPSYDGKATLQADTVWGALRGLETFSQLVLNKKSPDNEIQDYSDSDDNVDYISLEDEDGEEDDDELSYKGLYIPETPIHIEDAPRFAHRGLMLDTSRNFFPVKDILRTLDGMAYNKMNVFHWHITDSQSFPIRLDNLPELTQKGAYVLNNKRLVYSKNDVARIVRYARSRGIRVIPEIDMPAHTASWGKAYPEITTCTDYFFMDPSNEWSGRYAAEPTSGQLNPVKEKTYEIVNGVISEIASMFPDAWFHGGGDEPVYKCWETDNDVTNYMAQHNATGKDLLEMFLSKEIDSIRNAKKTPVLWEDSVTSDNLPIPSEVVLQVWMKPLQEAVKKGYNVIASHAQFWYLDCGHGGWLGNDTSYDEQVKPDIPESLNNELEKYGLSDNYRPPNWGGSGGDWCSPFKSWQRIYSYDLTFNLTQEEANRVLGGEVALWAEQTDKTALDVRLWPRAAGAAEVLWSGRYDRDNVKRDIGAAMPRMFDWRYRMLRRGIQAEALQPLWCGQNPHMCDATYPGDSFSKHDESTTSTPNIKLQTQIAFS